ncbi:MAG TPA: prenyltransferase/squalene oxidase repeat-containing protein [Isosphaeraceae bacterium]|nr:prenyltransferase/squalene oxidase repeat-containing protein [Isosphaeraceae bacterium]
MTATLPILVVCLSTLPGDTREAPRPEAVRGAVERALPRILTSTAQYPTSRDCFSCHHQAIPILALSTARERGFDVSEEEIAEIVDHTEADLHSALDRYRDGRGQPGGVTRAGYALFTLELGGQKRNETIDSVVEFLLKRDEARDHWHTSSNRPPSEASDFTSTYLALRAFSAHGREDQKDRIARRSEKVRRWLDATKPRDTEDRVFRLLALKAVSAPEDVIREAAEALVKTRRPDGGWAQIDGGASDAYATGSALVALFWAGGMVPEDPVYQEGVAFLLADQKEDGSWFVASRSKPFQPYFESGFPYGKDQFISMAATSWAVTALSLACPKP